MMTYIGEACVRLRNAEAAIDLAFDSLKSHCSSRSRQGVDYTLYFESSRARIRPEPGILWMRVESDDFATCAGIKTLIVSELGGYTTDMPHDVLWIRASDEPFDAIFQHEKSGGGSC